MIPHLRAVPFNELRDDFPKRDQRGALTLAF